VAEKWELLFNTGTSVQELIYTWQFYFMTRLLLLMVVSSGFVFLFYKVFSLQYITFSECNLTDKLYIFKVVMVLVFAVSVLKAAP